MKITIITVLSLVLSFAQISQAQVESVESVLDAYVTASGGLNKLNEVKAVSYSGSIPAYQITFKVISSDDGNFRYENSDQIAGCMGDDCWVSYKGLVDTMNDDAREQYAENSFKENFLHGLLRSGDDALKLEYLKQETKYGQTFHVLKSKEDNGLERLWYFNAGTGLLDKTIEDNSDPGSEDVRMITRYSGYITFNGITLCTIRESSDLNSGRILQPRSEIEEFIANPALEPDVFQRPEPTAKSAEIKDNEIQAKILEVSDYGSFVTNITRSVIQDERVKANVYTVKLKGNETQHRFYDDLEGVNIGRGDYILLFNNSPTLWIVKAYEGMSSEVEVKAGDLVYLIPLLDDDTSKTETNTEIESDAEPEPVKNTDETARETVEKVPPARLPAADKIMAYRDFGNTGLKVSDISVGAGSLSDPMVIEYALDKGINYFDTAETYGRGVSQDAIGEVARRRRDEMIICTKLVMNGKTTKEEVIDRLEKCLLRLKTSYVDVLMIHGGNQDAIENPAIFEAFKELQKVNKVKFTGVSSHSPDLTRTLWPVVNERKVDVILLSYDPAGSPDLKEFLKAANEKGIALVAMKVFSSGHRNNIPEYTSGKFPYNVAALRWVLSDPYLDTVIPSATFMDHIDQYVSVSGYTAESSVVGEDGPEDDNSSNTQKSDESQNKPEAMISRLKGAFHASGTVNTFSSENLWKHIDGADHQYLSYGCKSLTITDIVAADNQAVASLEIYLMPDTACSFGVYSRQKGSPDKILNLGTEGYLSGSMLNVYQGPLYIQILGNDETEKTKDAIQVFAAELLKGVNEDSNPPDALKRFPEAFNPDSFGYIYDGVLGVEGLGNAFTAQRKDQDNPGVWHFFPGQTTQLVNEVNSAMQRFGKDELVSQPNNGLTVFKGNLKYKGLVAVIHNSRDGLIITGPDAKSIPEDLVKELLND